MPSNGEPPGSLLEQILDEFGLQWTQIAVVSGLAFSAFGLEQYFNTATWMLATIVTFTLVFFFRRQIPGRLPVVAATCVGITAVLLLFGYFLVHASHKSLPEYLRSYKVVATAYIGFAVMLSISTMMLSYRRQEEFHGGYYPRAVMKAIQYNLVDVPFYRSGQHYEITFLEIADSHVKVRVRLTYSVVNRTKQNRQAVAYLTPMRSSARFLLARIGTLEYDTENPAYRTESGLQIPFLVPPRGDVTVELEDEVLYGIADSDLFASYLPATDFAMTIVNPFPNLRVVVESLFRDKIEPVKTGSGKRYEATGAVLPYQGFKVDWMLRRSSNLIGGGH